MGAFSDALRRSEHRAPDVELERAARIVLSRPGSLPSKLREQLLDALEARSLSSDRGSIDIADEVRKQCALVRALRSKFLTPEGQLQNGIEVKDAQQAASAFNSFLTTYLRAEAQVNRFERLSHIEQAVIETVKRLPEKQQEVFFEDLEKKLQGK